MKDFLEKVEQAFVYHMDALGWEQDGEGLAFIHVKSGKRVSFGTLGEALDFASEL